jgi:hypothetical protein
LRLFQVFCGGIPRLRGSAKTWKGRRSEERDLRYSLVQDIKCVSSRRLNRQRRSEEPTTRQNARRGYPIWQHQFWDRFVRHAKEFGQRLDYMHFNPVRRGLAATPEQWRWSSCQNFSLEEAVRAACPIRIDYVSLPNSCRG